MGDTSISWTDKTWNCVRGCSRVSTGCTRCYAERQALRFNGKGQPYEGLVTSVKRDVRQMKIVNGEPTADTRTISRTEPRWTGVVKFVAEHLADPLRWKKPCRVFVNSMSDLFHDHLTNEQIAAVFGVMAACPQHTFQLLTKRAKRMREWFAWALEGTARAGFYDATFLNHLTSMAGLRWEDHPQWLAHCENTEDTCSTWPLPNVWLGVSVENQAAADERIPELLATPAAVRFLSCEPLIGEVDLDLPRCERHDRDEAGVADDDATPWCIECDSEMSYGHWFDAEDGIAWVIAGCESGPGARPCSVEWLRLLRDQCASAGVPFFLKQATAVHAESPVIIGEALFVAHGTGSTIKKGGVIELPYLDGVQHAAFPEAP